VHVHLAETGPNTPSGTVHVFVTPYRRLPASHAAVPVPSESNAVAYLKLKLHVAGAVISAVSVTFSPAPTGPFHSTM
jgi:hypothetical protein